ncbi:hypothetical protein BD410DRAFT_517721 [Rickenella mellea]|uniref:Uncharacterized protein n=1 Tax=Rickenella mellea TaxID=50990 RepID=A0A4Y7QHL9_9AGAM|nr:hypothetical protein BD410DRAFT_517721 [Rickenella mellea]
MAENPVRTLDSRIPYDSEESFQIPATFQFGDDLLADYGGESFFDRIDTTFSTPVSTRNVVKDSDIECISNDTPKPRSSTPPTLAISTRGALSTAALKKPSALGGVDDKSANDGPQANDMFERKKRDSYLQKGIDLSQHSTSRFRRKENQNPSALLYSDHPIQILKSKHLEFSTAAAQPCESRHRGNSDEADTCEVTNWRLFDKVLS